jgi:hypothetical protein
MADQPPKEKSQETFNIPEPRIEKLEVSVADSLSFADAAKEVSAFSKSRGGWWLRSPQYDWLLNFVLKLLLFIVVISMNIWWTHRVLQLVWQSASMTSQYHLANSVLIALVTTSLANFLALVAIVAKHLFPSSN